MVFSRVVISLPLPTHSDQLSLELAGSPGEVVLPWGGQSPRELTSAFKRFSLGAPPAGGLRGTLLVCKETSAAPAGDPLQLELFLSKGG